MEIKKQITLADVAAALDAVAKAAAKAPARMPDGILYADIRHRLIHGEASKVSVVLREKLAGFVQHCDGTRTPVVTQQRCWAKDSPARAVIFSKTWETRVGAKGMKETPPAIRVIYWNPMRGQPWAAGGVPVELLEIVRRLPKSGVLAHCYALVGDQLREKDTSGEEVCWGPLSDSTRVHVGNELAMEAARKRTAEEKAKLRQLTHPVGPFGRVAAFQALTGLKIAVKKEVKKG